MARRRVIPAAFATAMTLATGCGTTQPVVPLGAGKSSFSISAGGPVLRARGVSVPAPMVDMAGAHGVRENLELTGHFDAAAAAFGVAHVAPGVAYHPVVRAAGWVPTVTLAGSIHVLTDFSSTRAAPLLTPTAAWRPGGRHVIYLGADAGMVSGSPARAIVGPLLGGEFRAGHVGLALESKWLAPYHTIEQSSARWISPGGRGYFSVLFGFNYYLGVPP